MEPTPLSDAKDRLAAEVDRRADLLIDVSHQIHEHPELRYEERFAHDLLTGVLEGEGLDVDPVGARHRHRLRGTCRHRRGRRVAVLCEYDALPGIGHACGHNIIAAAGLGAGLAAAALADELGGPGRHPRHAPPRRAAAARSAHRRRARFDGVDAAMMVHPADADLLRHGRRSRSHQVHVTYTGEAAHAAAFPHQGRNALDAAVLGYVNVAALRQHIGPTERIHGDHHRRRRQGQHRPRVRPRRVDRPVDHRRPPRAAARPGSSPACRRAPTPPGCTMDVEWHRPRLRRHDRQRRAWSSATGPTPTALGRTSCGPRRRRPGWWAAPTWATSATRVPSIHPMIKVAPPACRSTRPSSPASPAGPRATGRCVDGAKALAWTRGRPVARRRSGRPGPGRMGGVGGGPCRPTATGREDARQAAPRHHRFLAATPVRSGSL